MTDFNPVPLSFYRRNNVLTISRELLGKELCTWTEQDGLTSGIITETEAYRAENDQANHASGGNITERNSIWRGGLCLPLLRNPSSF